MLEDHQHFFDLNQLACEFPQAADDMLKDIRMVNEVKASCRLVRMYRKLPLHLHATVTRTFLSSAAKLYSNLETRSASLARVRLCSSRKARRMRCWKFSRSLL